MVAATAGDFELVYHCSSLRKPLSDETMTGCCLGGFSRDLSLFVRA